MGFSFAVASQLVAGHRPSDRGSHAFGVAARAYSKTSRPHLSCAAYAGNGKACNAGSAAVHRSPRYLAPDWLEAITWDLLKVHLLCLLYLISTLTNKQCSVPVTSAH